LTGVFKMEIASGKPFRIVTPLEVHAFDPALAFFLRKIQ
jgi:hypothetical protein